MARMTTDTRTRILMAADEVFSDEGFRGGGVDRIAQRAGVTKRTLYYHFRSKDDLIAACLSERDRPALKRLRGSLEADAGSAAERVNRLLEEIAKAAANPRWRGCGFLRAAFELAELPGHPARAIAANHKRRFEEWLAELIRRDGLPEAKAKARSLMLVIDGTVAQLVVHRDIGYATHAMALVRLVLDEPDQARKGLPTSPLGRLRRKWKQLGQPPKETASVGDCLCGGNDPRSAASELCDGCR